MGRMVKFLAVVIGLVVSMARPAQAVLISGVTPFAGAGGFSATVTWDVYAPGDPDLTNPLAPSPFFDYFYMITNTSTAVAGNIITTFSVGNPSGAPIVATGSFPNGGVPPTLIFPLPGGTSYFFFPAPFPGLVCPPGFVSPVCGGTFSERLFLSSTFPPASVLGGLIALGPTASASVPGPFVPEPSSLVLLGLGLLGGVGWRRRWFSL